jgi:type II secretory pathway component GspD/PulD (secretin)
MLGGKTAGAPRMLADPNSNSVLARGTAGQIQELRRLITVMDVPEATSADTSAHLEILHLKYAKVEDVAAVLRDVFGKDPQTYRLGTDVRTNSLILSATPKQTEEVRRIIKELDVPVPQEGGNRKTP